MRVQHLQKKAQQKDQQIIDKVQRESHLPIHDFLKTMEPAQAMKLKQTVESLGQRIEDTNPSGDQQTVSVAQVEEMLLQKNSRDVIKQLIDQLYVQEKKYQANTLLRQDILMSNDVIFHIERSHCLAAKDTTLGALQTEQPAKAEGPESLLV